MKKSLSVAKKILPTKDELVLAIPETIAASSLYFPINVFLETVVSGMDNSTSLVARGIGFVTTYFGMPYIMRGRYLTRGFTRTTSECSSYRKFLSDTFFSLVLGISTKAILYTGAQLLSREPFDYSGLVLATGSVALVGSLTSGTSFYVLDVFKELTGYKSYERTPSWLRSASSTTKKAVATGFVLSSLALGGYFYHLNREENSYLNESVNVLEEESVSHSFSGESSLSIDDYVLNNSNSDNHNKINNYINDNAIYNNDNNVNTNLVCFVSDLSRPKLPEKTAWFLDYVK